MASRDTGDFALPRDLACWEYTSDGTVCPVSSLSEGLFGLHVCLSLPQTSSAVISHGVLL
jgi:hypothetical protein